MSDQNKQEQSYGFTTSASVSSTPTLFETLKTIWYTPNLMLIAGTNCLEWTDMFLFIHCATLFSSVFAPQELQDKMGIIFTSMMWTIRPLGALILGFYADKLGRRIPLLTTAFLVMCLTVALIITPTYAQFGMWAFGIFMLIRAALTFVMAGESVLADVYAFESSKRYEDTCLTIPFVDIGTTIAGVSILMVSSFLISLGESFSPEYIVRILLAFLIVAFLFLFKNRLKLAESRMFIEERDVREDKDFFIASDRMIKILQHRDNIKSFILYSGTNLLYPIAFLISYVYSQSILKNQLGYSPQTILNHNLNVVFCEIVLSIIFPLIAFKLENNNKFTRRKLILCFTVFIPLIGGIILYNELQKQYLNTLIFTVGQAMILYTGQSLICGHFLLRFKTVGRARLVSTAWAFSKILAFLITFLLIEPLKNQNCYDYIMLVFFGALAVHITCIYLSREPTAEEKSTVFNGHYLLKKRIPLTKPEDRIINGF